MSTNLTLGMSAVLMLSATAHVLAAPPVYDVVPINVPNSTRSGCLAISNTNQVVGWSVEGARRTVWKRSPSGTVTTVLNNAGEPRSVNPTADEPVVKAAVSGNGHVLVSYPGDPTAAAVCLHSVRRTCGNFSSPWWTAAVAVMCWSTATLRSSVRKFRSSGWILAVFIVSS